MSIHRRPKPTPAGAAFPIGIAPVHRSRPGTENLAGPGILAADRTVGVVRRPPGSRSRGAPSASPASQKASAVVIPATGGERVSLEGGRLQRPTALLTEVIAALIQAAERGLDP